MLKIKIKKEKIPEIMNVYGIKKNDNKYYKNIDNLYSYVFYENELILRLDVSADNVFFNGFCVNLEVLPILLIQNSLAEVIYE